MDDSLRNGGARWSAWNAVDQPSDPVALLAAIVGALIGVAVLARGDAPVPGLSYIAAVILALTGISAVAAGIPAFIAARRDPLSELRVP